MKNKKVVAFASVGVIALFALFGGLAANKVFAAEERISITDAESDTSIQAFCETEVLSVYKERVFYDTGCTVILPAGYKASDSNKGMYVSERQPLDSSNVYYTISDHIDGKVLGNMIMSDDNKHRMETKFKEAYGAEAVISSYKYEKTQIDGCPAYKIELSCNWQDMQMDQLIYIIAADKTYTITYSQASDDDRMQDFIESAKTIQVVFEK